MKIDFTILQQSRLCTVIFSDNFAEMKKIALFILFVFTLVQVVPAMQSLCKLDNELVFNLGEEKGGEKTDTKEKKENKDYSPLELASKIIGIKTFIAFHIAEKIHSSPCLEKLTPPPNFC